MGQIFLWAWQGYIIDGVLDTERLVRLLHHTAGALRSRGYTVLEVPATLSLPEAIAWINVRAQPGEVALALKTDAFVNSQVRGTSVFYLANNTDRQTQAEQVLRSLMEQLPALVNRGAQADTTTETGRLAFLREIDIPALVLSLGFVTNMEDRTLMLDRSIPLAEGLANGLALWRRSVSTLGLVAPLPPLNISLNGQLYGEQGLSVEGNAYVPADLLDQAAITIPQPATVRWRSYGGVTYIRAVDLREAGVFVGWAVETLTLLVRTLLPFKLEAAGNIIGSGHLLATDYEAFLQQVNPAGLQQFPEIAQLYQEEAAIEGVNPDVAFAQALLEANFFGFSRLLTAAQNNFGSLGSLGGVNAAASFPSVRLGVRAHIQHLKAYASEAPLVQAVVDPRFSLVTRGVAPYVAQLSRRWSSEAHYGTKLLALLRRLYESAGLL